jgi:hypothetical protein
MALKRANPCKAQYGHRRDIQTNESVEHRIESNQGSSRRLSGNITKHRGRHSTRDLFLSPVQGVEVHYVETSSCMYVLVQTEKVYGKKRPAEMRGVKFIQRIFSFFLCLFVCLLENPYLLENSHFLSFSLFVPLIFSFSGPVSGAANAMIRCIILDVHLF